MDLPCDWAQFLYVSAERGLEDNAIILTWYREGPAMTQQFNMNHGHPDGDLQTSILPYEWFVDTRNHDTNSYTDWKTTWNRDWNACTKVGLMHHVMNASHVLSWSCKRCTMITRKRFRRLQRGSLGARDTQPFCSILFGQPSLTVA